MGREKSHQQSAVSIQPAVWTRMLDSAALYGLLLIVAMRSLISETYDSALTGIDRATGLAGSPTPATTAAFDLGILLCCIVALAGIALRRERWQWTRLEIGWLLMIAGAGVSTWAAGNQRLALNASADWLITLLIIFVVPNLCQERRHGALVLIVIAASGFTSLTKSAMQLTHELPETQQHYFENKIEFWTNQGIPLDDPRVELFERRMRGTAATGFFPHSNVQAALLVLCGFASLALAGLTWPHRGVRVTCMCLGVLLLAATVLSASKGGVLAGTIGVGLIAAAWMNVHRVQSHWRGVLVVGWILVGAGCTALLLYGLLQGGLPTASLQFRWEYWKITRQIIADRPWTGEGALNFDRAYLLHKPIEYPEEIKDPHNFVLSLWSQWGILGAAGLIWMLFVGSHRALKMLAAPVGFDGGSIPGNKRFVRWGGALVIGYLVLRLLLLRSYWLAGDIAGSAVVLFDLQLYGLVWSTAVAGLIWLLSRTQGLPAVWGMHSSAARTRLALLCGIAAFLLHNLVEFAVFYPGTLTPFAALAGLMFVEPHAMARTSNPRRYLALLIGAGILLVCFLWLVFLPVTRANALLNRARTARSPDIAAQHLREATLADRFDATAPSELAGVYAQYGQPAPAIEALQIALERNPMDAELHQLAASIHERRFEGTRTPDDLHAAVRAARVGVQLYPASPDKHLALAEVLARAASVLHSPEWAAEAGREYQRALDLDAARPGTDEVRRWSAQRRRDIEQRAESIRRTVTTTTRTTPSP